MRCAKFSSFALVVCVVSTAWAQTPSAAGKDPAANRRITLDVVVTDKSASSVTGLQQQDFTILDSKLAQPITSFSKVGESGSADDPPMRIIFVIDQVNVSFRLMSNARQQLEKYLRQQGQLPVPMSLVIFNEKSTQVQGAPTRDGNKLADSVHAIEAGALRELEGTEFPNQIWRLQISLRALEKLVAYEGTQPGRKLLVWLSAGWPLIAESSDHLSTKDLQTDFHTIVKLSTGLREARVSLYSIDPLGTEDAGGLRTIYYENFLEGVTSANKFRSGDLTLGVIAVQSGGQVLNRSNDLANLISKCVADAKSYYTLSFDAAPPEHADEYHDLQVKVDKPGVIARTRTGYYSQP